MALAIRVGVTLPAVSGWERNLYRPRRPTAQRLDDELSAGGAVLAAFGYAPLASRAERAAAAEDTGSRLKSLEDLVAQLSKKLTDVQNELHRSQHSGDLDHSRASQPSNS